MSRGRLRVYLGAAPGVGKTVQMLQEGHRLQAEGADVVIGLLETHGRAGTAAEAEGLELVPRRTVAHRGRTFTEMDTAAVLARRPDVALVDELAHTNVPGCATVRRHEDVAALLEAGIDVITTLNVQHLAGLQDVVEAITGIRQAETVPDEVVRAADEIELVDLPPEVLRQRLAAGKVYPADRVDAALTNFFRPGNLGALREIALTWLADRVEEDLSDYRQRHGISDTWETRERIVVAMTGADGGDRLVRRAARMAGRGRGELVGVHVALADGLSSAAAPRLEGHRALLEQLGGRFREVVADTVADGLLAAARAEEATQIVLGATRRGRLAELLGGSVIQQVLRGAGRSMDVHVIPHEDADGGEGPLPRAPRLSVIGARRRAWGFALAVVGIGTITGVLAPDAGPFGLAAARAGPLAPDALTTPLLLHLGLTALVAVVGGIWPALTCAAASMVTANAVFTEPRGTLAVDAGTDLVSLTVFLLIGVLTSVLADLVARRAAEAARARAEVRALTRLATAIPGADDPLELVVHEVRRLFDLVGVALVDTTGGQVLASSGTVDGTADVVAVGEGLQLQLAGGRRLVGDGRLMAALVAQVATATTRTSLQATRVALEEVTASHALRTALLSAVSHDLRTPLASIVASASSLVATDVALTEALIREFGGAIVADAGRLDRLITNLLDMSRLEAGVTRPILQATGLEEVVAPAVDGLEPLSVEVDVPASLPEVWTDPVLLERVVANLVDNAVRAAGGSVVRVLAGPVGDAVLLRVVDRGPGIPVDQREAVFRPFQRLGDAPSGRGVGLGLAIARGLSAAMGCTLEVEDTPGGGTTMVLTVPVAGTGVRSVPALVGEGP